MRLLVTGSNGFIGKNLIIKLNELLIDYRVYSRENSIEDLPSLIKDIDFIIHLAGENRPPDEKDFDIVNVGLTNSICETLKLLDSQIPIIFASSTQVKLNNKYGLSKLKAENKLKKLSKDNGNPLYIYRFPGVFGKWGKPNYNSVVATFCYNISQNLPIKIDNPSHDLSLIYIDDLVEEIIDIINGGKPFGENLKVKPEYKINLLDLAEQIKNFRDSRETLIVERVGEGLIRKLYATYVSYFSPEQFTYSLTSYEDERGKFSEILKTKDSGQFSFFTAKPGVTRGGHYHNTKTEKFIVIQGEAKFTFSNIISDETFDVEVSGLDLKVVETVPGWFHDITNIGKEELLVALWANEIFNPNKTDTFVNYSKV